MALLAQGPVSSGKLGGSLRLGCNNGLLPAAADPVFGGLGHRGDHGEENPGGKGRRKLSTEDLKQHHLNKTDLLRDRTPGSLRTMEATERQEPRLLCCSKDSLCDQQQVLSLFWAPASQQDSDVLMLPFPNPGPGAAHLQASSENQVPRLIVPKASPLLLLGTQTQANLVASFPLKSPRGFPCKYIYIATGQPTPPLSSRLGKARSCSFQPKAQGVWLGRTGTPTLDNLACSQAATMEAKVPPIADADQKACH